MTAERRSPAEAIHAAETLIVDVFHDADETPEGGYDAFGFAQRIVRVLDTHGLLAFTCEHDCCQPVRRRRGVPWLCRLGLHRWPRRVNAHTQAPAPIRCERCRRPR